MAIGGFQDLLSNLMGGGYQGVGADAGGNTVTTGPNQYYRAPTQSALGVSNYMPTGNKLDTQGVANPWAQYGMPQEYNPTGSYRVNANGTYTPSWALSPNWMPQAWGGQLPVPQQTWGQMTGNMMGQGILPGLQSTAGMAPSIYTAQNIMGGNVPQQRIGSGGATGSGASRNQYVGGGSRNPIGGAGVSGNPAGGRTGGAGATAGTGGGRGQAPGGSNYQTQSPFNQNPVNMNNAINAPGQNMASNPLMGYYQQNPTNMASNPLLTLMLSNPVFANYLMQALRGGV